MSHAPSKKTLAVLAAFGALATVPAGAQAATWKASTVDPTGDGPAPGRDITEVKFRYKSNGSVLFAVTFAGPIDAAAADGFLAASVGKTCRKPILTGGGLFSTPDPVGFVRIAGDKLGKPREGKGEISSNVFTMSVKHSSFKGLKPRCFALVLVDPATAESDNPTVFDETDEIKIKP